MIATLLDLLAPDEPEPDADDVDVLWPEEARA